MCTSSTVRTNGPFALPLTLRASGDGSAVGYSWSTGQSVNTETPLTAALLTLWSKAKVHMLNGGGWGGGWSLNGG
jgi:hypothetical protein